MRSRAVCAKEDCADDHESDGTDDDEDEHDVDPGDYAVTDRERLDELRAMSGYEARSSTGRGRKIFSWVSGLIGLGMILSGFTYMITAITSADYGANPLWFFGLMFGGIFPLITGLAVADHGPCGMAMTSEQMDQMNLTTSLMCLNTVTMNTSSMMDS